MALLIKIPPLLLPFFSTCKMGLFFFFFWDVRKHTSSVYILNRVLVFFPISIFLTQQKTSQHLPVLHPTQKITNPWLCSCKTTWSLIFLSWFYNNPLSIIINNSIIPVWYKLRIWDWRSISFNSALHCGLPMSPSRRVRMMIMMVMDPQENPAGILGLWRPPAAAQSKHRNNSDLFPTKIHPFSKDTGNFSGKSM